jgi:hypothetical protein
MAADRLDVRVPPVRSDGGTADAQIRAAESRPPGALSQRARRQRGLYRAPRTMDHRHQRAARFGVFTATLRRCRHCQELRSTQMAHCAAGPAAGPQAVRSSQAPVDHNVKDLPAINAAYNRIDGALEQERVNAIAGGKPLVTNRIGDIQRINDQAYFVLCWGQIELAVNEACRAAIRHRRDSPQRHVRRAWDLYNPKDDRLSGLSFENRARLVLDAKAGPGSAWAKLMSYYSTRNQIAHGALQAAGLDIPAATGDFYAIQSALEHH